MAELAAAGVREVVLIGQDTGIWGRDLPQPSCTKELLERLAAEFPQLWLRLMYIQPEGITDELLLTMGNTPNICSYIDIPLQHVDEAILKRMNRSGDPAQIAALLQRIRALVPDMMIRTTLMTGFPGETEEQFEDLCNFVKEVKFDRLGCFAYSAEENTVAAKMDGQIDQETKDKRAELVMQIQTGIMAQKQAEKVGQTVHVLCDGIDEESGLYLCRTTGDAPEVDGNVCVSSEEPLYPGQFYDVLVDDSDLYDLYGTVAK